MICLAAAGGFTITVTLCSFGIERINRTAQFEETFDCGTTISLDSSSNDRQVRPRQLDEFCTQSMPTFSPSSPVGR